MFYSINRRGKRYGNLIALKRFKIPNDNNPHKYMWACVCDCGRHIDVSGSSLNSGNTKSCGCLRRKRMLDESVFDTITEESAYWIGFLMADGCISGYKEKQIELSLQNQDKIHLEKFLSFLKSNSKLGFRKRSSQYRVSITSEHLSNVLKTYGVTPRKSFTATPDKSLIDNRHFWRGMIDGDGTLGLFKSGYKERRYPVISLCGSHNAVLSFKEYCDKISPNLKKVSKEGNIYKFTLKCKKAKVLINNLYCDSTIYLERKYKKYLEICIPSIK